MLTSSSGFQTPLHIFSFVFGVAIHDLFNSKVKSVNILSPGFETKLDKVKSLESRDKKGVNATSQLLTLSDPEFLK